MAGIYKVSYNANIAGKNEGCWQIVIDMSGDVTLDQLIAEIKEDANRNALELNFELDTVDSMVQIWIN